MGAPSVSCTFAVLRAVCTTQRYLLLVSSLFSWIYFHNYLCKGCVCAGRMARAEVWSGGKGFAGGVDDTEPEPGVCLRACTVSKFCVMCNCCNDIGVFLSPL